MTAIKFCPMCDAMPVIIRSVDMFRLECPGCHDHAELFRSSLLDAVRDWNDGITDDYVEEVAG